VKIEADIKMKNCIFYSFFGDLKYKELLLASLQSLSRFFPKEHIYVYSSYELEDVSEYANVRLYDFKEGFAIPIAIRYNIAQELFENYDNILYLDLDTVCIGDVSEIFKNITDNKILIATEYPDAYKDLNKYSLNVRTSLSVGSAADDNWAGPLLNAKEKEKYRHVPSICAGVFAANKSTAQHMNALYQYIEFYENHGFQASCADQHAFCKYLLINDIYDFGLQPYVTHQGKDMSEQQISLAKETDIKILHFAGGVTAYGKIDLMNRAYNISKNDIKYFNTRNELLNILPKNLKIAELGVFKGEFSSKIVELMNPSLLYLVDLFSGQQVSGDKDGNNIQWTNLDIEYENLSKKYTDSDTIKVIKDYTYNFLQSLEDGYLDMVYIDADHSYEGVKNDLELSYKKVKIGGIISGHDYTLEKHPGVVKAVDEFCKNYNLNIKYLTRDGCPTFLIIKTGE
jgi:lipopolysaccharide biosynthesis glycosyltransferase